MKLKQPFSMPSFLKEDVLDWLLEPRNPSVRYWTLLDLKGFDPKSSAVRKMGDLIMESEIIKTILDAQSTEGYWVHKENMYLPKYKATTHQLLILAELGASLTPGIKKAVEQVFEFQRNSGHFLTELPKSEKGRNSVVKNGCCFDGNVLYYLTHFGYLNDPRAQRLLEFIYEYHDDENAGWKCRAFPINPDAVFPMNCFMGATKVLKAFSIIPDGKQTSEMRTIIDREVENILENEVYRYLKNPDGSRKAKAGWKRFGFPLFYQSDILEVLDTLTRLGVKDERMQPAIDIVLNTQQSDGKWLLKNSFNGKMWVDIEEKHKPGKWITLRALRVLKRFID
ncbi:MAG: nitrogen fixation protein NifH [Candidatus Bathyarchaeota archaeon]|nr:nitrogen fixation protein NifH [Candidatus Bathyarchaeota archaeon]